MTSALRHVFQEALELPYDKQDRLAASMAEQIQDYKTPAPCQARQDEISAQIKRGIEQIESGQGMDAKEAMRKLAKEFGIKSNR